MLGLLCNFLKMILGSVFTTWLFKRCGWNLVCRFFIHSNNLLIIRRCHMWRESTDVSRSWEATRNDQAAQATGFTLWWCRKGLRLQAPWLWGLLPRQLGYRVAKMHRHWQKKFTTIKLMVTQGGWPRLLQLAFQSIGIIYGDVGTSPLYAISSTFPDGIKDQDDLLGVLSLILYTLILIPMVKYVFIVLYADDNGDGKLIRQEISTCQPAVVTICLLFIRYFTFNSNILLF